jgi:hypothetical protein
LRATTTQENKSMRFAHPCVISRQCVGCDESAMCDPHGEAPFPVPKPGYCRKKGTHCFSACPAANAATMCKGGARNSVCPEALVRSTDFTCVPSHHNVTHSMAPHDARRRRQR